MKPQPANTTDSDWKRIREWAERIQSLSFQLETLINNPPVLEVVERKGGAPKRQARK